MAGRGAGCLGRQALRRGGADGGPVDTGAVTAAGPARHAGGSIVDGLARGGGAAATPAA
jgi:hypothetical protein